PAVTKSRGLEQARAVEAQLRDIQRALRRPVESEMARGRLTAPQRNIMGALAHAESGFALKDLAREVGLSHSTVSGIVDRLEQKGWVERRVDRDDGRRTVISLAPVVRRYLVTTLPQVTLSPLAEALERFTPRERETLLRSLEQLNAALSAVDQEHERRHP